MTEVMLSIEDAALPSNDLDKPHRGAEMTPDA
jgi:hypothetical protein